MIKVSVIVPVYNGEKYLEECMDSICGQTLQDIEIICVDDGSTDSSFEILKQYQEKDSRIQLYQQKNQYAGVARNVGKSHAIGEYLAFWDCDDFFEPMALEKMYLRAKETDADVCVCDGYQFLETKGKRYSTASYLDIKKVPQSNCFNRFTNPEHYLDFTCAMPWNKLFKRTYIEGIDINFQPVRNCNDLFFVLVALGYADRITVVNERLVNYRMFQENSLMSSYDKSSLSIIESWIDTKKYLEKEDGFVERTFVNKAVGSLIYMLSNFQTWDVFQQFVQALQDYGLKELCIFPRDMSYYYSNWSYECVQHLYQDTIEQFAIFLSFSRYKERTELRLELRDEKEQFSTSNDKIKVLTGEIQKYKIRLNKQDEELNRLKSQNDKLTQGIDRIRKSWTFRVGKVIMWIPSRLKQILTSKS